MAYPCSNHDIDPDIINDPCLDSYHIEGAPLPEDIKALKRAKQTFVLDICG
jgi:hypothetical protein